MDRDESWTETNPGQPSCRVFWGALWTPTGWRERLDTHPGHARRRHDEGHPLVLPWLGQFRTAGSSTRIRSRKDCGLDSNGYKEFRDAGTAALGWLRLGLEQKARYGCSFVVSRRGVSGRALAAQGIFGWRRANGKTRAPRWRRARSVVAPIRLRQGSSDSGEPRRGLASASAPTTLRGERHQPSVPITPGQRRIGPRVLTTAACRRPLRLR